MRFSPEKGMWALTNGWPETRRQVLGHGKDRSHPGELLRSIRAWMELDFPDWDTILAMGPQGMGGRSDHLSTVIMDFPHFTLLIPFPGQSLQSIWTSPPQKGHFPLIPALSSLPHGLQGVLVMAVGMWVSGEQCWRSWISLGRLAWCPGLCRGHHPVEAQ